MVLEALLNSISTGWTPHLSTSSGLFGTHNDENRARERFDWMGAILSKIEGRWPDLWPMLEVLPQEQPNRTSYHHEQ